MRDKERQKGRELPSKMLRHQEELVWLVALWWKWPVETVSNKEGINEHVLKESNRVCYKVIKPFAELAESINSRKKLFVGENILLTLWWHRA